MMNSVEAALRLEHVSVRRGAVAVVDDVGIEVAPGTLLGILGPSGSGKSSLMRAIAGIQRHVSGTVRVLGLPAGSPGLRRRLGFVTQSSSVYPDLTVAENLRYHAALHGLRGAQAREATARALATVDLSGLDRRMVGTLSGGQLNRVSLAAALVAGPEMLILDEPTVGLDPVLRRDLWRTFHDLTGQGVTLLVSTHVMDEAMHCDELMLMRAGRVIATGDPADLLARTGAADLDEAFLRIVEVMA